MPISYQRFNQLSQVISAEREKSPDPDPLLDDPEDEEIDEEDETDDLDDDDEDEDDEDDDDDDDDWADSAG